MAAHLQPREGSRVRSLSEAALEAYVKTWNMHNVNAWAATLTEDIWYTEASDYYQRMKGRKGRVRLLW